MTTNINSNGHKTERIPEGRPLLKNINNLTPREDETLNLLAQGYNNQQIAELMAVNLKSVERYINTIYRTLGLTGNGAPRVLAAMMVYASNTEELASLAYRVAAKKVEFLQDELCRAQQELHRARERFISSQSHH